MRVSTHQSEISDAWRHREKDAGITALDINV